jgi:hypothetical protein
LVDGFTFQGTYRFADDAISAMMDATPGNLNIETRSFNEQAIEWERFVDERPRDFKEGMVNQKRGDFPGQPKPATEVFDVIVDRPMSRISQHRIVVFDGGEFNSVSWEHLINPLEVFRRNRGSVKDFFEFFPMGFWDAADNNELGIVGFIFFNDSKTNVCGSIRKTARE